MNRFPNRYALKIATATLVGIVGALQAYAIKAQGEQQSDQMNRHPASARSGFGLTTVDGWDQVVVLAVEPAGSAALAGIQVGDVIQSIGGALVRTSQEMNDISDLLKEGDQVEMAIEKLGQQELVLLEFRSIPGSHPAGWQNGQEPRLYFEAIEAVQLEKKSDRTLPNQNSGSERPIVGLNDQSPSRDQLLKTIETQQRQIDDLTREIDQLRRQLQQSAKAMRF
jgi:membrane-associated protease RseP (regulator of RpoE activity)